MIHNVQALCHRWKEAGLEAVVSCLRQKDRNKTTRHRQREPGGPGPLRLLLGEPWGSLLYAFENLFSVFLFFLFGYFFSYFILFVSSVTCSVVLK